MRHRSVRPGPYRVIAGLVLVTAGCVSDHFVTCTVASAPAFTGFVIERCQAPFADLHLERDDGRWWVRLREGAFSRVLDLRLPLANDCETIRFVSADQGATDDCHGWATSLDDAAAGYGPYRSHAGSGTATLSVIGTLPSRTKDGRATIALDFGVDGVTLQGRGSVTLTGRLVVEVGTEPIETPPWGAACAPCRRFDEGPGAVRDLCADEAAFTSGCYCAVARMYQCTSDADGCASDADAARASAARFERLANEVRGTGPTCAAAEWTAHPSGE